MNCICSKKQPTCTWQTEHLKCGCVNLFADIVAQKTDDLISEGKKSWYKHQKKKRAPITKEHQEETVTKIEYRRMSEQRKKTNYLGE
ncbi:hypothetical protein D3C86_1460060 [compost metagenome]